MELAFSSIHFFYKQITTMVFPAKITKTIKMYSLQNQEVLNIINMQFLYLTDVI